MARPVTWIEQAQRDRAGRLWLELSELGIADWATVVSIDECPAQIEGEGRLVTGRFEHSSAEVLNLYVEGEPDPIGTTASHPFWSQDRQAFVSAESLTTTERLRLENGRTAAVTRIEQLPGTQSVYNLEVDGEHVYHVGLNGVLVHNTCGVNLGRQQTLKSMHRETGGWSYHAWVREGLSTANPKKQREWMQAFSEATANAKTVNFSLDGLNLRKAFTNGVKGPFEIPMNVTNWEFRQVLRNPKTVFWQNGQQIPLSRVLERLGDLVR